MSGLIGSGAIFVAAMLVLSLFVLGATAFRKDLSDNDTWKMLASAIIVTGLLGLSSFIQSSIQRQQEHDLQDAIETAGDEAP